MRYLDVQFDVPLRDDTFSLSRLERRQAQVASMPSFITSRIAWRNLWRNRRRTSLALAAIGLSVALVLIFDGMLRWEGDWMFDTITGPMLGHVQAHAPEWRRTRAMDHTLRDVPRLLDRLRREPGVAAATPRVYAPALAALGEEGFAVMVLGVDIAEESKPTRLLASVTARLEGRDVFVGKALAEQMGVRPGAEIALVGQGVDGSLANDLYTVSALIETAVDVVNRQAVVMPIAMAQSLFAMSGEAHEIVVYARDPEQARRSPFGWAGCRSFAALKCSTGRRWPRRWWTCSIWSGSRGYSCSCWFSWRPRQAWRTRC